MLVAMGPHFKDHHYDEATQQCKPRIRGRGPLLVMRMVLMHIRLLLEAVVRVPMRKFARAKKNLRETK